MSNFTHVQTTRNLNILYICKENTDTVGQCVLIQYKKFICKKVDHYTVNIVYVSVSILHKSIAGHYRPVKVADGPITARYRFI